MPATVEFVGSDGSTSIHELVLHMPHENGMVDLEFPDGSTSGFDLDISPAALDVGASLLAPISDDEFPSLEGILNVLWTAAADGSLSDAEATKVMVIAGMIDDTKRDTTPGETARWPSSQRSVEGCATWRKRGRATPSLGPRSLTSLPRSTGSIPQPH